MLLGFKERFAEPIQLGSKVFTLRKRRKIMPKIGETLHMYSGLRTSKSKLISKKETLRSTQKTWVKIMFRDKKAISLKICVDGRALNVLELKAFVRFDGFRDVEDFCSFWILQITSNTKLPIVKGLTYKIVESLTMYHWTDLRYSKTPETQYLN